MPHDAELAYPDDPALPAGAALLPLPPSIAPITPPGNFNNTLVDVGGRSTCAIGKWIVKELEKNLKWLNLHAVDGHHQALVKSLELMLYSTWLLAKHYEMPFDIPENVQRLISYARGLVGLLTPRIGPEGAYALRALCYALVSPAIHEREIRLTSAGTPGLEEHILSALQRQRNAILSMEALLPRACEALDTLTNGSGLEIDQRLEKALNKRARVIVGSGGSYRARRG